MRIYYQNPSKAFEIYGQCNFTQFSEDLRSLNIDLILDLRPRYKVDYAIEGEITEESQKTIFKTVSEYEVCELNTKYNGRSKVGKLLPNATITFVREYWLF